MNKLLKSFLIVTLILLPFGLTSSVYGTALTDVSDTIEDSRPSVDANHTIEFITPTGVAAGQTITLTFDDSGDAFDLSSVAFGDLDVFQNVACDLSGGLTLGASASGATWGVNVNTSTDVITITSGTGTIAAGQCVQVLIGNNASGGTNRINNPASPGVYEVDVAAGNGADTGTAMVVVVATVTAQVTISQTLSFTVTGQNAGQCADYDNTAGTEVTTTSTLIDFGSVNADAFYDACQELSIGTNAANGYLVTVKESDQLNSGSDTIADGTCDGGCSESAEADWATPGNNGFGYCMQDVTNNGAETADAGWASAGCDAANTFFKLFSELNVDSPEEQPIMSSTTPATDVADIGYRLTVDAQQSAGTYTNNIIFVATPTF